MKVLAIFHQQNGQWSNLMEEHALLQHLQFDFYHFSFSKKSNSFEFFYGPQNT
jgi:hypothetical protein